MSAYGAQVQASVGIKAETPATHSSLHLILTKHLQATGFKYESSGQVVGASASQAGHVDGSSVYAAAKLAKKEAVRSFTNLVE